MEDLIKENLFRGCLCKLIAQKSMGPDRMHPWEGAGRSDCQATLSSWKGCGKWERCLWTGGKPMPQQWGERWMLYLDFGKAFDPLFLTILVQLPILFSYQEQICIRFFFYSDPRLFILIKFMCLLSSWNDHSVFKYCDYICSQLKSEAFKVTVILLGS